MNLDGFVRGVRKALTLTIWERIWVNVVGLFVLLVAALLSLGLVVAYMALKRLLCLPTIVFALVVFTGCVVVLCTSLE
jgi:hypothetical protein